ncbi:hypothetical protein ACFO9Q_10865 [Paenibacillus sp. GCM10023252]|uniref:hypothetical protein n=1 Tax=Paenibacillus sp. GCM10023252 TaxID=3252649 RepID=UPI003607DDA6
MNTRTLSETVKDLNIIFKRVFSMKLCKLNELVRLNYIELYPGRLKNGYLNEESIYITDNSFSLIVPAIKKGFEQYEPFNSFEIGKRQWELILREVKYLTEILYQSPASKQLDNYISIFYRDPNLRKSKVKETIENREDLVLFTEDLIEWINAQLETNECITLIGI